MKDHVNEQDWNLFRRKLPGWQEAYMEKLLDSYAELLNMNQPASERFWEMERRIRQDKRCSGVVLNNIRRSSMISNLIALLGDHVITLEDLRDFSPELQETLSQITVQKGSASHGNR